jgi:D-ribose pyranose/furanose isomerase RbsD
MKLLKYMIPAVFISFSLSGCIKHSPENKITNTVGWKTTLQNRLSEFGHRNWILIVDKAFPAQNSEGIIIIDTKDDLLSVLGFTMQQIDSSTHVKPFVYTDAELRYITNEQVNGIDQYKNALSEIVHKYNPQVLLHDSVFAKIDNASKLFKILILKTTEVIPYSSVFIELDCKYWSAKKEKTLREVMHNNK